MLQRGRGGIKKGLNIMEARVIKIFKGILVAMIHIYQHTLSVGFGPCCRFYPSCSTYAIESIEHFGIREGIWLSIKRLMRCHPLNPGGYDPVTDIKKTIKINRKEDQDTP